MNDLFSHSSPWGRPLSEGQRLDWLRLIRSENVGPATFRKLVNHFGGAAEVLEALPALARRGGAKKAPRLYPREEAEREMERALAFGARFVAPLEAGYPRLLAFIDQPPPLLAVKGEVHQVSRPALAIIGTRNCSALGRKITQTFARAFSEAGYLVVSGLARGIDIVAHESSVEGRTMAVVAGGLDQIYPPEHSSRLDKLIDQGALVVSEMPMGWTARGVDFPRRNRIIAGSSLATLVIEAAQRSGSLITTRLANEYGRQVFAIPGSPLDLRSEGPNYLIRQGATLVTRPQDVLEDIAAMMGAGRVGAQEVYDADDGSAVEEVADIQDVPGNARERILSAMSQVAATADDILAMAGVSAAEFQVVLLELELAGRLERQPGQRYALIG